VGARLRRPARRIPYRLICRWTFLTGTHGIVTSWSIADGQPRHLDGHDKNASVMGSSWHPRYSMLATGDFAGAEIALKETNDQGVDLVFPSQFTRKRPDAPDIPGKEVTFAFEGRCTTSTPRWPYGSPIPFCSSGRLCGRTSPPTPRRSAARAGFTCVSSRKAGRVRGGLHRPQGIGTVAATRGGVLARSDRETEPADHPGHPPRSPGHASASGFLNCGILSTCADRIPIRSSSLSGESPARGRPRDNLSRARRRCRGSGR
jgi:hypothetical protein